MRTANQLQTKDRQMTMSKKDFNLMASQFGQQIKHINAMDYHQPIREIAIKTVLDSIKAFCYVAITANSNFDSSRFYDFVDEIADGRRDVNGKLVKQSKVA
jgi:hypothetical protein